MSGYQSITSTADNGVAVITLDRADVYNAFDESMRAELAQALQHAAQDKNVRVVVLTGAGRGFSAGADLKEGISPDVERQLNEEYRPSFDAIINMDKPVISAINGAAAGIGLSLALICDLTVMARSAYLLSPFSTISLLPDGGANWLLVRQLGYKLAYQFAVEAQRMSAERALELGLVNRVVADEHLLDDAVGWAGQLAVRAPLTLAHTKRVMRMAMHADYDTIFREEARRQPTCLGSKDCEEGVAAFSEKRQPHFRGF